jgi:hypothetical protein
MSNKPIFHPNSFQPTVYQIRIKGHLDSQWSDWFEGLTITLEEDGDTLLTGPVVDQAALHGLLKKVRDLGMPLVSVNQVQFNETHLVRSKKEKMNTNKKTARMAGILYLIYIVIWTLAGVIGRSSVIVDGDAAATARNIVASAWQFRIGFVGELVAGVLFLLTAWALYVLLKPVNHNLALLFLLLNAVGVAVQCLNELNLLAALLLSNGADSLKAFQVDQLQALAMVFLQLYDNGLWICQIFFGAWVFPLGYLVFKSGILPKALGIVLMVHCVVWLMKFLQFFLFPGFNAITYVSYPLGFIAEFGLTLWLLIMGAKEQKPASIETGWLPG